MTWQGVLAGVVGAALVAAIAALSLGISMIGALVIVAAGVCGMFVDSLLGALVEDRPFESLLSGIAGTVAERALGPFGDVRFDNQTVNFLATLSAALVCAILAAGVGLAPL